MKKLLVSLTAVSVALISVAAQAQLPPQVLNQNPSRCESLRSLALNLVSGAQANSWTQINNFRLDQLKVGIESASFQLHCVDQVPVTLGRQSGHYQADAETHEIFINQIDFNQTDVSIASVLAAHEILSLAAVESPGLRGLNDSNYQYSFRLYQMNQTHQTRDEDPLEFSLSHSESLHRIERTTTQHFDLAMGGGTGVGGGGDLKDLAFRAFWLDVLRDRQWRRQSFGTAFFGRNVLDAFLNLRIDYDVENADAPPQIFRYFDHSLQAANVGLRVGAHFRDHPDHASAPGQAFEVKLAAVVDILFQCSFFRDRRTGAIYLTHIDQRTGREVFGFSAPQLNYFTCNYGMRSDSISEVSRLFHATPPESRSEFIENGWRAYFDESSH